MGYSALQTGLLHIPFSIGVMIGMAFLGRRYLARYGRGVVIAGAIAMAVGVSGVLAWMDMGSHSVAILPALLLAGAGMGLISGPVGSIVVARVTREEAGSASGMLKTVQQMGGALGVALGGSAYFPFEGRHLGAIASLTVVVTLLLACIALASRLPRDIFDRPVDRPT